MIAAWTGRDARARPAPIGSTGARECTRIATSAGRMLRQRRLISRSGMREKRIWAAPPMRWAGEADQASGFGPANPLIPASEQRAGQRDEPGDLVYTARPEGRDFKGTDEEGR